MKKTLGALLLLGSFGTFGTAMAQSSVTLFGIVDAGITYGDTKDGHSVYGVSNGGNATSRLGFRGVEDLGGGVKVGFWLEGRLDNDTGGDGFDFQRRSSVSLMGDFGEVRLGRTLTRAYDDVSRYDVFGQVGIGQNHAWSNTPVSVQRVSNLITYISPSFHGFKGAMDFGFGEIAGHSKGNRYVGGSLTYDNGPLSLGASVERWNDAHVVVDEQIEAYDHMRSYALGASYDLNVVKLSTMLRQQRNKVNTHVSHKYNTVHLGAIFPINGVSEARLGYNYYDTKGVDGKAHQLSLGYVYNLSKRTALYGTYAFMKNKSQETYSLSAAGLSLDEPAAGKSQHAVTVGVRHSF